MEKKESFDRRGRSSNKNKLRHLAQYKNMSDEEFDTLMADKEVGLAVSQDFEKKIEEKIAQFSEDYDLSDLKINDKEILRGLIQAIISLETYEQMLFNLRADGINPENIIVVEKLQKTVAELRKSISDYQNDLNITRKTRKSDQETSVLAYIDSLKDKARRFIESRHQYIYCEECSMLLCTAWFLYIEENNVIKLKCHRKLDDGTFCGHVTQITSKQLLENRGVNKKDVIPESMI